MTYTLINTEVTDKIKNNFNNTLPRVFHKIFMHIICIYISANYRLPTLCTYLKVRLSKKKNTT